MRSLRKLLPLGLTLTLSACFGAQVPPKSTPTPAPLSTRTPTFTSAIDPLCASLSIIQASRLDTDGTKEQIAENNRVVSAVCGK